MIAQLRDLDQKVQEVAMKFPGEVVKIRYSISHDWSGDPAIFFRILLSDDASRHEVLGDVTRRVERELFDDRDWAESGYTPYFNFRSKSEHDKMRDPAWE